ncbi:MAG: hypothetical protein RL346_2087 [Verrucomicrobiota bacterium]|jgi:RNA polymerase sigma-70 factor (ECF subfamily)
MGDGGRLSQSQAAAELGMTNGAIKIAIHGLRQKFGEAICMEFAETVDIEEGLAGELRYLIEALRAGKC